MKPSRWLQHIGVPCLAAGIALALGAGGCGGPLAVLADDPTSMAGGQPDRGLAPASRAHPRACSLEWEGEQTWRC